MLEQRRRRWADVVQIYTIFCVSGLNAHNQANDMFLFQLCYIFL